MSGAWNRLALPPQRCMAPPAAGAEAWTLALFEVGSRSGGLVPHLGLWKGGLVAGLGCNGFYQ